MPTGLNPKPLLKSNPGEVSTAGSEVILAAGGFVSLAPLEIPMDSVLAFQAVGIVIYKKNGAGALSEAFKGSATISVVPTVGTAVIWKNELFVVSEPPPGMPNVLCLGDESPLQLSPFIYLLPAA